jgi:hypothetical protein
MVMYPYVTLYLVTVMFYWPALAAKPAAVGDLRVTVRDCNGIEYYIALSQPPRGDIYGIG